MRKQLYYFSIILFFFLGVNINVNSQNVNLSSAQNDSIINSKAEQYFYQVYLDKDSLSNKEKIDLLSKSDSMFQKLENWEYSIASKQLLCKIFQQERAYEKIDQFSKEGMDIVRSHLKKDNSYYGRAMNLRAVAIYENKRDFATAIPLIKETIEVYKKNNKSLLRISKSYINLGSCYQSKGDYGQAIEQFQKGLKIQFDSLNFNGYEIPFLFNQLGVCYSKKNQFDEASKHFKNGLKYAEKVRPQRREVDQVILYLYQNLADLYLKNNRDELAQKYISKALKFQKNKKFLKDAYSFQLQGDLFFKNKRFDASIESYQNSQIAAQQEFENFDRHPEIGITYFKIGNVKGAQNELNEALKNYQLALINSSISFNSKNPVKNPLANDFINPLQAIDILQKKAETYVAKYHKDDEKINDLKNAFENYSLAIQLIAKTRQSFNAEESKYDLAEKIVPIYEGAIEVAYNLFQITKEQKWLESGFQFAEQNKATVLLDAMQNSEALMASDIPDSLLRQEYEGSVEIAFYKKLIHEASQKEESLNVKKINDFKNKLLILKEAHQNLIDFFENHFPNYYALKYNTNKTDIKQIQSNLKNTCLIEYFVGQKNIFVFTISSGNIICNQIVKDDHFEKDLEQLIRIINTEPESKTIGKSLDEFHGISSSLYNLLLKNSIEMLPDGIDHVIIVPDDILAFIPFSVLANPKASEGAKASFKSLDYLFNSYKISYAYSATLLFERFDKKHNKALKKFIGIAPEFSKYKESDRLSPLSCNVEEVDRIGSLIESNNVLTKQSASLDVFKSNIEDYQIIHLATHTNLDNENSAFNKIYFSDNFLSQNDLYQLRLNASLVVLSACNTGVGELKKGEGVMSLSRGFTHAGCPSILMSLWSVDDCATADIMFYYYQSLKEGKTKDIAIKDAKLKYLDQTTDILQSHPYYWAGFVQYGDVAPIAFDLFSWTPLLVVLVLLVGLIFFLRKNNSV